MLLHGFMAHSIAYRKIVPKLAAHYRVIIPDLPAHGRDLTFQADTVKPQVAYMVEWLDTLLDAVASTQRGGIRRRVHLVGHSLSALVAFMWAKDPGAMERVKSLTLVSPGVRLPLPGWTHHAVGRMPLQLAKFGASSLGMRMYEPIQWRKSRMTSSEVASYVEPFRDPQRLKFMLDLGTDLVREPDRLAGAEKIRHRTLVLWGDRDHLIRRKTVSTLRAGIPDAQMEIFRGVGHCPMEDSPDHFQRVLANFVAR
ncbi:alpha/beta fold hydrolase [Bradymonas sediminis]|uniref:Uncharacterized protein n=1 Tax=Bradymonas sediminis TaxID=1548548 RepID=A0A2Z4FJT4_9DELT|nr:alpha/beta hydrolase [Bradymonas sediminis]AWV88986.1 hypothetical protein DN745_06375 [Bradymonas sediminis]TDP71998.1 pimeloyl-ACP methyl ester carboxylesterase [Bradymonas sediminis]